MRNAFGGDCTLQRFLVGAVFVLVGCSKSEPPPAVDVPELIGQAELSIGVLDGPPEYVFGRVSGVAMGPDGMIYVSDAQQHVVRVFSEDGSFVRPIGRAGEGPGELGRPCCIAFGPEGRLWIRDSQNRRYQGIGVTEGAASDPLTIRMSHYDGGLFAPITFEPDGGLVDVGHHAEAGSPMGLWRFSVAWDGGVQARSLVDEPSAEELGTQVKEVAVNGGVSRHYFPQPFGPVSMVAHGPAGRWATGVSSDYDLRLHGGSELIEIRGRAEAGPPLSADEREWGEQRLATYVERGGGGPSDYPPVPDRKPPLADLFFDRLGRLWVELSVPDGADRRADVYSPEGVLVERRVWPSEVSLRFPAWVGEDTALGIATDSLGVQRVVRLRF